MSVKFNEGDREKTGAEAEPRDVRDEEDAKIETASAPHGTPAFESAGEARPFDPAAELKTLPHRPGCYRYFDKEGRCLYVGKARDLKRRVTSYFQKTDLSPRIRIMVSHIARLETTVTGSEAEALLLENNLIKTLNPKYNILFRDDKSYPYIRLGPERFPRLSYYRGGVDKKSRYFGPYPNAQAVRETMSVLQKVFGLRTCENAVFAHRSRACLLGQIGRCSAPCVDKISPEDYEAACARAADFLEGRTQDVVADYEARMWAASEAWRYEEAALWRDRIAALTATQHRQAVETTGADTDADVFCAIGKEGTLCVNLALVRGGRHLGDRAHFTKIAWEAQESDCAEALEAFIVSHYETQPVPGVVIAGAIEGFDAQGLETWLTQKAGRRVTVVTEPRELRRRWLAMCREGAAIALARELAQTGGRRARLEALVEALGLEVPDGDLDRVSVECFDISHTAGEATQASCVVFAEGQMQGKRYRRFTIEGVQEGDDYGAMRQVLTRRYAPVARGEAQLPSVVLVDGGKGQVEMARQVFIELGLPTDVIVGVAKGEGRKTGLETLVFPQEDDGSGREPLVLGRLSPALMLVAEIRDEAHRFAITGMRAKRDKARTRSTIEDLEGVGPKRRAALLAHFGGMKGLKNASAQDIARVDGISSVLAGRIYAQLHPAIPD